MPFCSLCDGISLYYESSGKGNPIFFIHGWSFNSRIFNGQRDCLQDQFQVVGVDLRGHGKSETGKERPTLQQFASDLDHILKRLELNEVSVVGWSMGGLIAIRLFSLCPERLKSLILVSATPSLIQREGFAHALPLSVVKRLRSQVTRDHLKAIKMFRDLILSPEEERSDIIDAIKKTLNDEINVSKETAADSLSSLMEEDLRNSVENISLPALIIHGEKDQICFPGAALFLKESLTNAKLIMMQGCGHAPFLTSPLQFNKELTEFLHSL